MGNWFRIDSEVNTNYFFVDAEVIEELPVSAGWGSDEDSERSKECYSSKIDLYSRVPNARRPVPAD